MPKNVEIKHSWIGMNIFRKISIYFTKLFLYTPITANQVTLIGLIIGIIGGILLAFGQYWYSITGALLLLFTSHILDLVDGEIARYRKAVSVVGDYYEHLNHGILNPFIFVGLSFGVYNTHSVMAFAFGFSAVLFSSLIGFISLAKFKIIQRAKIEEKIKEADDQILGKRKGIISFLKELDPKIFMPSSFAMTVNLVLIGAIFNFLDIVLIVYGIILPIEFILRVYYDVTQGLSDEIEDLSRVP